MLRTRLHQLLAVALPSSCAVCRGVLDEQASRGTCGACWRAVRPPGVARCLRCGMPSRGLEGEVLCLDCSLEPPPYDEGWCLAHHEAETAEILRLLKYRSRPRMARPLADRILADRATADFLASAEMLVPVPLHRRRRRERGFDQAAVLARALARRLRKPCCAVLERRRPTRPQVGRSARARRRSLRGAFAPGRDWDDARGRVVCLVDDVWTTGTTLEEASRSLRRAKPAAILAFAVSRA